MIEEAKKWPSPGEVAAKCGESERSIRYRAEHLMLPAVKNEGRWFLPPCVVGQSPRPFLTSDGIVVDIRPLGPIPEEEVFFLHSIPGEPRVGWLPATSGTRGVPLLKVTSGLGSAVASYGTSGICGYVYVANSPLWVYWR